MDFVRRAAWGIVFPLVACGISIFLPRDVWYRVALRLSYGMAVIYRLCRRAKRHHGLHQARFLNRLLSLLTRRQRPFPISWTAVGIEKVSEAKAGGCGLIYCSAHLPLIKVAVRALMESNHAPTTAIARDPGSRQEIAIWGLIQRLPAMRAGPGVLLRTRSVLREGGSVLLLVDKEREHAFSPNIFRLARKTGAKILFFFAELRPDGVVHVHFQHPPNPCCATDAEIDENLQALHVEVDAIWERSYTPHRAAEGAVQA